jgi:hypothetical protein
MRAPETLIVGGGIAGLACARRLFEAGRDFLLVTDRLGGRMFAAGSGAPFGAAYLTRDYTHVRRHVRLGPRVRRRDVYYRDGGRLRTVVHARSLGRLGPLARLCAALLAFRARLNRLRARAPSRCQAELLREDDYLLRCAHEPASAFVRANGLEELDEVFTNPLVHSTVFVPTSGLNTFYYLACLMPVILRIYLADFSRTLPSLTAGFGDRVALGHVHRLELDGPGGHRAETVLGTLRPRFVVAATPPHNLRTYCPELAAGPAAREVPVRTLHVRGRRRPEYLPGKMVFLPPGDSPTVLFPHRGAGLDVLFCKSDNPDLERYYLDPGVVGRAAWRTAVVLAGAAWRPLEPRPGVFTVGDYNVCGLEDSYLTGLFAANRILAELSHQPVAVPAGVDLVAGQVGV